MPFPESVRSEFLLESKFKDLGKRELERIHSVDLYHEAQRLGITLGVTCTKSLLVDTLFDFTRNNGVGHKTRVANLPAKKSTIEPTKAIEPKEIQRLGMSADVNMPYLSMDPSKLTNVFIFTRLSSHGMMMTISDHKERTLRLYFRVAKSSADSRMLHT